MKVINIALHHFLTLQVPRKGIPREKGGGKKV